MTRKSVWSNADGLKVGFGTREATYTDAGKLERKGSVIEHIVLDIRGSKFVDGMYVFDSDVELPVGASPESAVVEVSEAFVMTGTAPTIRIGTDGDGVPAIFGAATEAQGEAVGTYVLSVTATPLTVATAGKLQVSLGGTGGPAVTAAGKMKIVLRYRTI